ncbi:MAG: hypothetical protein K6G56_05800 [Clostridiales bacterium]|nr:hypothetical protein [Clostridiales bacterium]
MIIATIIKKLLSWLKEHTIGVILAALGIGVAAGTKGAVDAHKAKKINRQALDIQQAALERHEQAYQETQSVLAMLGDVEKDAIDSFVPFADAMERIQGRPKFKSNVFSAVKLPNYEPEEIKKLSTDVQMAIVGAGGVGVGALAGLAAFGAGAIVAAPALAGAGLVLCIKGFGLKRKAIENKKQAKQMEKSVEEIVAFYAELRTAADSFRGSVTAVYSRYAEGLRRVEDTLATKTIWKQFSREEKKNVENTVLLARLLYEMTQTKIVVRQEKEDKLETVNTAEIAKLQKQATKLLGETA